MSKEPPSPRQKCKCVVVGNNCVGKTCLLIRYTTNVFPGEYTPTVFDNYSANVVHQGKEIELGLWDTYESDYDRLRPLSYPQTDVFLLCFDISNKRSLIRMKEKWQPEIKHHVPEAPYFIIGNKKDLRDNLLCQNKEELNKLTFGYCRRGYNIPMDIFSIIEAYLDDPMTYIDGKNNQCFVTDKEATNMCKEIGAIKYMSCSALTGEGVKQVFDAVLKCFVDGTKSFEKKKGCHIL